jgi:hypothetical protein
LNKKVFMLVEGRLLAGGFHLAQFLLNTNLYPRLYLSESINTESHAGTIMMHTPGWTIDEWLNAYRREGAVARAMLQELRVFAAP